MRNVRKSKQSFLTQYSYNCQVIVNATFSVHRFFKFQKLDRTGPLECFDSSYQLNVYSLKQQVFYLGQAHRAKIIVQKDPLLNFTLETYMLISAYRNVVG